uniref:Uncharacterized protein n=2 Tax=Tetraselmis sp. GSL018 TaxID=582737 RepID=A0A061S7I9_9CHLO
MSPKKRSNPYCGHLEPALKIAQVTKPVKPVNSLQDIMNQMRLLSKSVAGSNTYQTRPILLELQTGGAPCFHCGRSELEDNLVQCAGCLEVFCRRSCSVANYDAREDRHYCLSESLV